MSSRRVKFSSPWLVHCREARWRVDDRRAHCSTADRLQTARDPRWQSRDPWPQCVLRRMSWCCEREWRVLWRSGRW